MTIISALSTTMLTTKTTRIISTLTTTVIVKTELKTTTTKPQNLSAGDNYNKNNTHN